MRCSSTTVNRSSRARPACTRAWSGLLAAGLASKTTIAATGGSSYSVSASPRRDMLIVRAGGAGRSAGTATRPASMPPKWPPVMQRTPPPTCRKSPVSAGSARIARIAAPAPPWRCSPRPRRIAVGRVCAKPAPERAHVLDGQAADLGRALDGPLGQARLELGPALGVAREPVAVLGALVEHRAHEAERERRVGARARREVLVAALGGVGAQRVDRDDVRAAPLRREHEAPLVEVRREQVRAPQDHEPRVLEVLGIHADRAAVGRAQGGARGRGADRRPAAARRRAPRTAAAP